MPELTGQAATQLENLETSSGMTFADFVVEIDGSGLEKHGQIVSYLKSEHGIGHGNANLVARLYREEKEGGPPPSDDLLDAQYSGAKAELLPIYRELAAVATALGDDVDQVVQKSGVSFRRDKQFLLVQAPSSKRVQLGLNLDETPIDARVQETTGMCSHRVDITSVDSIDDDVVSWIRASYRSAG